MSQPENASIASWIASLPLPQRQAELKKLARTEAEYRALLYNWKFWARPNQIAPPGPWTTWLVLAGRGFGKTRTGVEFLRGRIEGATPLTAPPGAASHIALVAQTEDEARRVMVEGQSGLLACCPSGFAPLWESSNRLLTWPNGAQAQTFYATEPDKLRGPQHDLAWVDELAKFKYLQDTWDQLQFGLRLGTNPCQVVTTTPRPLPLIKQLIDDPDTVVSRGTSYENKANLAPKFFSYIVRRYEGTRLGRQELNAEVLADLPGALWARARIDEMRVAKAPELRRIVVAIDPAATSGEDSDETGIVVAGVAGHGADAHGYVLEDLSGRYSPDAWGKKAVDAYKRWQADRIVAEVNHGGEMVGHVIRTVEPNIPFKALHASHGKAARAEPVAALDEQGRVHHVGAFAALEDQMCLFTSDFDRKTAGFSPDRVDARVWALTELMLGPVALGPRIEQL